jgi:putative FmdB family regulatory protein
MPLYEYQCEDCGMRFERRQHMNEESVTVCPECGGKVHRLIQPVGIIFKGSGFYVTDNRAKSSTSKPGSTKKQSNKPQESKSTGKSSTESE